MIASIIVSEEIVQMKDEPRGLYFSLTWNWDCCCGNAGNLSGWKYLVRAAYSLVPDWRKCVDGWSDYTEEWYFLTENMLNPAVLLHSLYRCSFSRYI